MQGHSVLTDVDSERQELETVQAALAKNPRLAKLLSYLVHCYFDGRTEHLTEFNIATEVFSRDPQKFIASDDAIARVETHRLRKKLKMFYESEGRHHSLQISIPLGTYIPVFIQQRENKVYEPDQSDAPAAFRVEANAAAPTNPLSLKNDVIQEPPPVLQPVAPPSWRAWFSWKYVVGAVIVFVMAASGVYIKSGFTSVRSAAGLSLALASRTPSLRDSPTATSPANAQHGGVSIPFRMIAGYSGPPQKDAEGFVWQGDQYYQRGWELHRPAVFIHRASNPLIYQYGRDGDTDYDIPVKPGTYELHLYFMQASETALGEESENKAVFNLALNGKVILQEFDIVSDAMGRNTADERVFRDVSPGPDGELHLHLSTVVGTPSISAIALFDGTPGRMLPIRLVTQPMPLTDHSGILWRPDNYFDGGRYLSHNLPSTSMTAGDVLTTERYGHFTYALPVDTRDEYTVSLYFVELFLGTPESSGGGIGSRVFRVICNGNILLDGFDIFKEKGSFVVLKKTFYHIRPTAQGKINLTFEPITNYSTVSAIEVIDESK